VITDSYLKKVCITTGHSLNCILNLSIWNYGVWVNLKFLKKSVFHHLILSLKEKNGWGMLGIIVTMEGGGREELNALAPRSYSYFPH